MSIICVDVVYKISGSHIQVHHMPKSKKRWVSYELMLKRTAKMPYRIVEWKWDDINPAQFTRPYLTRDLRHPVTIAAYREIRARDREWWAEIHGLTLALDMVLHPRLGETSLWHDLPEPIVRLIVCEAYLPRN